MRTARRRALVLAVAAALVTAGGATAHGRHSTADGYIATFVAVKPNVLGVLVNVFGPENLLRVTNYSGTTVVVLGAHGEPYLRFAPKAVYENAASPTAYLNESRGVPASAGVDAEPRWRKVATGTSHTWHEHRIVWSDDEAPEVVRENPGEPHLIFNWSIPATAAAKPFRITGFLGWSPPADDGGGGGGDNRLLVAGVAVGAALAVLAIVATLWRRARRPA